MISTVCIVVLGVVLTAIWTLIWMMARSAGEADAFDEELFERLRRPVDDDHGPFPLEA